VADLLLIIGIATAVVFLVVMFFEGALRPHYSPAYHTGSELTLGDRGWRSPTSFRWG